MLASPSFTLWWPWPTKYDYAPMLARTGGTYPVTITGRWRLDNWIEMSYKMDTRADALLEERRARATAELFGATQADVYLGPHGTRRQQAEDRLATETRNG